MTAVTVSSHGDVTAKHSHCQSLNQLITVLTNSVFLFWGHSYSHSVVGSILMVVSLLNSLTVPSLGRPVRKVCAVKEETDVEPTDAVPPSS